MATISIYSVDKDHGRKVLVGTLEERRKRDCGSNIAGLLKLAVSRFKLSPGQEIQVELGGILIEG